MQSYDFSPARGEQITARLLMDGHLPEPTDFAPLAKRLLLEAEAIRFGIVNKQALQRLAVALITASAIPALHRWCEATDLREDLTALLADEAAPWSDFADYLEVLVAAHRVAHWQEDSDV